MKRTPLRRKTPLRQTSSLKRTAIKPKPRADDDKVTPEVAALVFARDRGCVALRLDPGAGECRTKFGERIAYTNRRGLTLQHVWLDYSVKAKRAPSDVFHLLVLCEHHHLNGWATSHVNLERQRAYLKARAMEVQMREMEGRA